MENQRNEIFDIIRGIAIILVVIGHSGCPNYVRNLIYLFHMPVFYFISGYFFYRNKEIKIIPFIKRKLKTLYLPFLVYEFCFLIFSGIIYKLHLSKDIITIDTIFQKIINIFIFKNQFSLLPFWFLRSLFLVNIFFLFEYFLTKKHYINTKSLILLNIIAYSIGSYFCMNGIHLPLELQREFILLFFFYLGYYIKINTPNIYIRVYLLIIPLIVCASFAKIDIAYSIIHNPVILLLCSICGILLLYNLSLILEKMNNKISLLVKKILCICSKYSLIIFATHLLCFKIVSFAILKVYNLNINELSTFPTIKVTNSYWWIIYSIVGIIIPILTKLTYNKIINYIK